MVAISRCFSKLMDMDSGDKAKILLGSTQGVLKNVRDREARRKMGNSKAREP